MHSNRTRGNGHKSLQGKCHPDVRKKKYSLWEQFSIRNGCSEKWWNLLHWEYSRFGLTGPWITEAKAPFSRERQMMSSDSFQSQLFCDSVKAQGKGYVSNSGCLLSKRLRSVKNKACRWWDRHRTGSVDESRWESTHKGQWSLQALLPDESRADLWKE